MAGLMQRLFGNNKKTEVEIQEKVDLSLMDQSEMVPEVKNSTQNEAIEFWTDIPVIDALILMGEHLDIIVKNAQKLAILDIPYGYNEEKAKKYYTKLGYHKMKNKIECFNDDRNRKIRIANENIRKAEENNKLLRFINHIGLKILDPKAVLNYKLSKTNEEKAWNTTSLKGFGGEIPIPVLDLCVYVKEKVEEYNKKLENLYKEEYHNTYNSNQDEYVNINIEVDELVSRNKFDLFIKISTHVSTVDCYIAVWNEPGFDSEKYWISPIELIEKI